MFRPAQVLPSLMTDADDAHDVSMTITAARGTPQDVFAVPTLRPQRELVVGDLLRNEKCQHWVTPGNAVD